MRGRSKSVRWWGWWQWSNRWILRKKILFEWSGEENVNRDRDCICVTRKPEGDGSEVPTDSGNKNLQGPHYIQPGISPRPETFQRRWYMYFATCWSLWVSSISTLHAESILPWSLKVWKSFAPIFFIFTKTPLFTRLSGKSSMCTCVCLLLI